MELDRGSLSIFCLFVYIGFLRELGRQRVVYIPRNY